MVAESGGAGQQAGLTALPAMPHQAMRAHLGAQVKNPPPGGLFTQGMEYEQMLLRRSYPGLPERLGGTGAGATVPEHAQAA